MCVILHFERVKRVHSISNPVLRARRVSTPRALYVRPRALFIHRFIKDNPKKTPYAAAAPAHALDAFACVIPSPRHSFPRCGYSRANKRATTPQTTTPSALKLPHVTPHRGLSAIAIARDAIATARRSMAHLPAARARTSLDSA